MSSLIKHYKRKPNVVEAIYLDPATTDPHDEVSPNAYAIAAASGWMHGSGFHDFRVSRDRAPFGIIIKTPEGEMEASPGDYIIKGMQGEFYPHKGDWFANSYEEVRDE